MDLKQAAIFLSIVGIVMCMNLKVQQSEDPDEHRNVLYFKTNEQSLPDHNTNIKPNFKLPNVVCSNSTYYCSPNYTCCPRVVDKTFSCCPIEKVSSGDVICPGGAAICPDENTCCQLSTGDYGCCPLPEATCCSDHTHCCPQDYICNVTAGTCTLGTKVQQWLTKTPAKPLKDIDCKDNSRCPVGNTCCKLESGQYGCCPFVSVVCPGGESQCPDGTTCCKRKTGGYECCRYQHATCCSDYIHCCPQDYICNVTAGTCTLGTKVQQWLTKTPAKPLKDIACKDNSRCPVGSTCCKLESGQYGCCLFVSVVCPGGESQCPDGTTCCKLKTGGYGCCPYQLATCCSDGLHCCPEGYKCDLSAGFCVRGKDSISWVEKFMATPVNVTMTCKDSTVCSFGSTCCELGSSQYGCCPLKEAVCCSDHTHCCPQGYQCDVLAGTCNKGSDVLAWLTRKPSRSAPNV